MRQPLIILCLLSLPFFFSCKKNNSDPLSRPADTLSTGWKKIVIEGIPGLEDIFFMGDTGFAVSLQNIFRSTDGGNNWKMVTTNVNSFINLGMGSDTNAIFVSPPNKLLATHDGGTVFETVAVADSSLTDVFFVSATTAYAAGKSIWKSVDGGHSWNKLYDFTPNVGYKSLYFLTDQTGWVFRTDGLFTTINGGISWQAVNTSGFYLGENCSVFFLNTDSGYITNSGRLAKTPDAGVSWSQTITHQDFFHDIHFVSGSVGYFTDGTCIYKTLDGGNTWNKEVALGSELLTELHFTDKNHGWACGQRGVVLTYRQ